MPLKAEVLAAAKAWADSHNPGYWDSLSPGSKLSFGRCAKAALKAAEKVRKARGYATVKTVEHGGESWR